TLADVRIDEGASGTGSRAAPFAFLAIGAVWLCFLFFLVSTMSFGAIQNFAPAVFAAVYGLSLASATTALTAYHLGSAAGILAGGFLAGRHPAREERVIATMLLLAALTAIGLATGAAPAWVVLPGMAIVGFCTGAATPSRDLLVRRAALSRCGPDALGRVYGFVYSGLDVGLAVAPLLFGGLLDRGHHLLVLGGVATLQILAVAAALAVGRRETSARVADGRALTSR
ncbi:MAG: MFS transporter, partial [Anaeromyxobacteraceae bacterium]